MAYDEELANRVREIVANTPGLTEKRMFGGVAFLIGGNLVVSVSSQGGLLLRCDPDQTDALLARPHAAAFQMRGRSTDGWLRIDPAGLTTRHQLEQWIAHGVRYAGTLAVKR